MRTWVKRVWLKARCARIGKDWNGSSIPRKSNIGDTHFNVEPATPHVLSAEKAA